MRNAGFGKDPSADTVREMQMCFYRIVEAEAAKETLIEKINRMELELAGVVNTKKSTSSARGSELNLVNIQDESVRESPQKSTPRLMGDNMAD